MLHKRITFVLLAAALLTSSLYLAWGAFSAGVIPTPTFATLLDGQFLGELERGLKQAMPYQREIRAGLAELRYQIGEREQNGVYLSENGLLQDLRLANDDIYYENMEALIEFAGRSPLPVSCVLIPTACAIREEDIPEFAQPFNQQQMIQSLYRHMSQTLNCVDAYRILSDNRTQYLYYRTEENLTALGGYYVYSALAEQLGHKTLPQSSFIVQFAKNDYYGSLQQMVDYRCPQPDLLSVYHYGGERDFWVRHQTGEEVWYLQGLYDDTKLQSEDPTDLYLGGISGLTQLENRTLEERRLLLFGDETAKAYLPFLAQHYSMVTLVDLERIDEPTLRRLSLGDYDQVVFAYSLRTFIEAETIPHALWVNDLPNPA